MGVDLNCFSECRLIMSEIQFKFAEVGPISLFLEANNLQVLSAALTTWPLCSTSDSDTVSRYYKPGFCAC